MDFYKDEIFRSLVTQLLQEPFATQNEFENKDLFSACQTVLELSGTAVTSNDSLEKTRALISLVLCHLDLAMVQDFPKGKLSVFKNPISPNEVQSRALSKIEEALREARLELGLFSETPDFDKKAA